jgi:Fur family ferric uptake transcriptional regulator
VRRQGVGDDEADRLLDGAQLKSTAARIRVLEVLAEHEHLSSEQVHLLAERELSGLSLSTVYRTLDTLNEAGIVGHSQLVGSSRSYFLAGHRGHLHLTCTVCGAVQTVDPSVGEAFASRLQHEQGFRLDTDHLVVTGLCSECAPEASVLGSSHH